MKAIVLLTDFGLRDNYVGIMKGVILRINPDVRLVDLTHHIDPQNVLQGALNLKSAYRFFPKKTIFLAVVDPGVGSKRNPIIVKTKDYYFVGPDNGLFSPILGQGEKPQIFHITNDRYFLKPVSQTFHGRDIFAPVAAHLSRGLTPGRFGRRQSRYVRLPIPQPMIDHRTSQIQGEVIDIDHFGNLIINIETEHLRLFRGNPYVHIKGQIIKGLTDSYAQVIKGTLLAIMGSKDYLEISLNHGSAKKELNVNMGDKVKLTEDIRKPTIAEKPAFNTTLFKMSRFVILVCVFATMACAHPVLAEDQKINTQDDSADDQDIIKVSEGYQMIVPKGTQVKRVGGQIFIENPIDQLSRQFQTFQDRLDQVETEQKRLSQQIEQNQQELATRQNTWMAEFKQLEERFEDLTGDFNRLQEEIMTMLEELKPIPPDVPSE